MSLPLLWIKSNFDISPLPVRANKLVRFIPREMKRYRITHVKIVVALALSCR